MLLRIWWCVQQFLDREQLPCLLYRLADAHKRIKVLESLLANTYSAHPKLVDWAIQNKGEFKVDSIAEACRQSSESRNVEKQVQTKGLLAAKI